MVHFEPKSIVLDGVNDDRMRRALQSFAYLRHMEVAPEAPSAFQLMSETREAIAVVRKTMTSGAMAGRAQLEDTVILTNGCTRTNPMASSEDVEESLVELQQATEACRSFAVPNAGSVARAAGSTVISRLRPTVVPPVGASLLSDDDNVVEEREGAEAARAAWHASRRQKSLAAGGGDVAGLGVLPFNTSQSQNGDSGQRFHETAIMLKSTDGRNRCMSVPAYLLHQHQCHEGPVKAVTREELDEFADLSGHPTTTFASPLGRRSFTSFRRPSPLHIADTSAQAHRPPSCCSTSQSFTAHSPHSCSSSMSSDQLRSPDHLAQQGRTAPPCLGIGRSRPPSSSSLHQVAPDAIARSRSLGQVNVPNALLRPPTRGVGGSGDEAATDAEGTTLFVRKHCPACKVVPMASPAVAVRGSGTASPQSSHSHTPSSRLGVVRDEVVLPPSAMAGVRQAILEPPATANTTVRRRCAHGVQILLPGAASPKFGRLSTPVHTTSAPQLGDIPGLVLEEEEEDLLRPVSRIHTNSTGRGPPGSRIQAPGAVSTCPHLPSLAQFTNGPSSHVPGDSSNGLSSMLAALATEHAEVERVRRKVGAVRVGMNRADVGAARDPMDVVPSVWHH